MGVLKKEQTLAFKLKSNPVPLILASQLLAVSLNKSRNWPESLAVVSYFVSCFRGCLVCVVVLFVWLSCLCGCLVLVIVLFCGEHFRCVVYPYMCWSARACPRVCVCVHVCVCA